MSRLHQYETLKQEWIKNHPESTYQEYQQAMQKIAKQVGV